MAKAGLHLTVDCASCGALFRQARSDQRYCGKACGRKAWRIQTGAVRGAAEVACKECRSLFASSSAAHVYCSTGCAKIARQKSAAYLAARTGQGKGWAAGRKTAPRRECQMCHALFYAPPVLVRRGGGKFCSNNCRTKDIAMTPGKYPNGTHRAKSGRRPDLGGLFVRSSWEANWARYLNLLQAQGAIRGWRYEKKTFEFAAIKRGSKFYTPDFEVEENDGRIVYHEVKGYMDPRSATKLKRMKKYFPSVQLMLVQKKELAEVRRKLGALIPNWEGA